MTPEARELYIFTISDGTLYRQQGEPIVKNLARKMNKGIFKRELAIKLYGYLANNAAKKYTFEFDVLTPGISSWHQVKGYGIFTTRHRREAAGKLLDYYMEQIEACAKVLSAKNVRSNPNPSSKSFDVFLHGKLIDTVFYSAGAKVTTDEIKRSLINHDGYSPDIVVSNRRRKRK